MYLLHRESLRNCEGYLRLANVAAVTDQISKDSIFVYAFPICSVGDQREQDQAKIEGKYSDVKLLANQREN